MLKFIGKDGIVYQGSRKYLKVRETIVSEERSVQTSIFIDEEGVNIGFLVYQNDRNADNPALFGVTTPQELPLVSAYRAMLFMESLEEASEDGIYQCILAALNKSEQSLRNVVDRIGVSQFRRISTEMPPSLAEAFAYLMQKGIAFNKKEFTQEVRLGNQVYNQVLRDAGVENPVDIDERKLREQAAIEPLIPQMDAVFSALHTAECACKKTMRQQGIEVLKRGISEPGLVIGLAAIRAAEGLNISSKELEQGATLTTVFLHSPPRIPVISQVLVNVIEKEKSSQNRKDVMFYVSTLSDILSRWDSLPVKQL